MRNRYWVLWRSKETTVQVNPARTFSFPINLRAIAAEELVPSFIKGFDCIYYIEYGIMSNIVKM